MKKKGKKISDFKIRFRNQVVDATMQKSIKGGTGTSSSIIVEETPVL